MQADSGPETPDPALLREAVARLRSRLRRKGIVICLSGVDGSGKTTLARHLVEALLAGDVPVRYLHVYQWYLNLLVTPLRVLRNRHFGRQVLVFDRSIYDNIAVVAAGRHFPAWLFRTLLGATFTCHPRFEFPFCLHASHHEILRRRPGSDGERLVRMDRVYEDIASRGRFTRLPSNRVVMTAMLRQLCAGA